MVIFLKIIRKYKKLSQRELAIKVMVSHLQIARYETKGVLPPANVLARLSDVLDVSIDYLVNGDKSERAQLTLKDA